MGLLILKHLWYTIGVFLCLNIMLKLQFIFCLFFCVIGVFAQKYSNTPKDSIFNQVSDRYFEDQLYLRLTYNMIVVKQSSQIKNEPTYGVGFGIMKDVPMNKQRNFGMGIGLGYAYQRYRTNVFSKKHLTIEQIGFHELQLPIQLRWRTSTPDKYKFWRVYTGVQCTYLLGSNLGASVQKAVNPFQISGVLTLGHGFFNVHLRYDFLSLFKKDAYTSSKYLNAHFFQIGFSLFGL